MGDGRRKDRHPLHDVLLGEHFEHDGHRQQAAGSLRRPRRVHQRGPAAGTNGRPELGLWSVVGEQVLTDLAGARREPGCDVAGLCLQIAMGVRQGEQPGIDGGGS